MLSETASADHWTATRRRALPAWGLSCVVHLSLFVALALLLTRGEDRALDEADARPVGIVLARPHDTTNREYFAEALPATDRPPEAAAIREAAQFNPSPDELVLPTLALPSGTAAAPVGLVTVEVAGLATGRGRAGLPRSDETGFIAREQARLREAQDRGPTVPIRLFGSAPAVGNSFVFLLDRSQSMGDTGLGVFDDAQRELLQALQALGGEQRFQVALYHDTVVYFQERRLLAATPENKAGLREFLLLKAPVGSTEHERALLSALRLDPDVIFLLTDGGDPPLKEHQLRSLAKLAGDGTAIHCLHFGSGPPRQPQHFLKSLAALTGGQYGYIDVNQNR